MVSPGHTNDRWRNKKEGSDMDDGLKQKLLSGMVKAEGPLDTDCWLWTGSTVTKGHGQIAWNGMVISEIGSNRNKTWVGGSAPPGRISGLGCI